MANFWQEFQRGFRDSLAEGEALSPGYEKRVGILLPIAGVLMLVQVGAFLFAVLSGR
jgi:hypothetical protein